MDDERKRSLLLKTAQKGTPSCCSACGGRLGYNGLGEYMCERCEHREYDNYGKVRLYLEKHPRATVTQVAMDTGVSRSEVIRMVDEEKFLVDGPLL